VRPYYCDDAVCILLGDCREIVPGLGRFDLVATDPPYGKVHDAAFDHEWTNRTAMLASCREWRDMIVPAMRPNATLYWFAWPSLAGRIEALVAEKLTPLAHIVWRKPAARVQKACAEDLRSPVHETERILMFEHYGADNMALGESGYVAKCDEVRGHVFEPLRAYLASECAAAGHTVQTINAAWQAERGGGGGMALVMYTSAWSMRWLNASSTPSGTKARAASWTMTIAGGVCASASSRSSSPRSTPRCRSR
jgi:hypothetical protein